MIPGFSAAPMFIKTAGGPVATGRVKFSKDVIDASNYVLYQIDIEIYTNLTGHDIGIFGFSIPDYYSGFEFPSPYGFVFSFHGGEVLLEYSYSSATLGTVALTSPVFHPTDGYIHTSTSGVVGSFAADVWYDFSITV